MVKVTGIEQRGRTATVRPVEPLIVILAAVAVKDGMDCSSAAALPR